MTPQEKTLYQMLWPKKPLRMQEGEDARSLP